jgi:nicotinamide-nucleotide amidase
VGRERVYRTSLFVTGRSESHVEEAVQPVYSGWRTSDPPIETTILASPGQVELHLSMASADADAARDVLARANRQLSDLLGRDVFSTDGRSMEMVVGSLLRERGSTIAAAESCTGGLLMSRLTDVPGSSAYVLGGVVSYSNELKTGVLGVPDHLLQEHGAVSEPVAVALAEGVKNLTGAHFAVSITGVAGPGGGTAEKPIGTVSIAVITDTGRAHVRTFRFIGGRELVRFQASQAALEMVRRLLMFGESTQN